VKFRPFSQRQAERAGKWVPPTNIKFPAPLRRLLAVIISETIGLYYAGMIGIGQDEVDTTELWVDFERLLYREVPAYADYADKVQERDLSDRVRSFIGLAPDDALLDIVDIAVAFIDVDVRDYQGRQAPSHLRYCQVAMGPDDALREVDVRLREAGTVYRVADGAITKSTDDFSHEAAVVPALQALAAPGFENALKEFHDALAAYRGGKYDIVLQKANHAFESTMKVISGKMRWPYEETATAKKMLDVMMSNRLVAPMRDSALKALATLLESDLPTLRNKMPSAGHGAGEKKADIPEPVAAYAVNVAAANIRLLMESYRLRAPIGESRTR
jgi:hypothetical protein